MLMVSQRQGEKATEFCFVSGLGGQTMRSLAELTWKYHLHECRGMPFSAQAIFFCYFFFCLFSSDPFVLVQPCLSFPPLLFSTNFYPTCRASLFLPLILPLSPPPLSPNSLLFREDAGKDGAHRPDRRRDGPP